MQISFEICLDEILNGLFKDFIRRRERFPRSADGNNRAVIRSLNERFRKRSRIALVEAAHGAGERAEDRIAPLIGNIGNVRRLKQAFISPRDHRAVSGIKREQRAWLILLMRSEAASGFCPPASAV